jgi:hypothetical protein
MKKVFTLLFAFALALGVTASFAAAASKSVTGGVGKSHVVSADDKEDPDNGHENDTDHCENSDAAHATCCDKDDTDGDSGCCPEKGSNTDAPSPCFCPKGEHKEGTGADARCVKNKPKCDDDEVLKNGKCVPKPTKDGSPGCKAQPFDPAKPPKSSNCAFVFGTVFLSGPAECVLGPTSAPAPGNANFTPASANCVAEKGVMVHLFNTRGGPPNPAPAANPANTKGKQTRSASSATSVQLETPTNGLGQYGFLVPAGTTYYVCENIPQGEVQTGPKGTETRVGAKGRSHGEAFTDGVPAGDPGTGTPNGDTTCRDYQAGQTGEAMRADEQNHGWYVTPSIGDPLYGIDFANAPTCGPGGAEESGAVSYGLIHRQGGVETSALSFLNPLVHDVVSCQIVTALGL